MTTVDNSRQHNNARYRDCATIKQITNIASKHYNGCYYCGHSPTAEDVAHYGLAGTQLK